MDVLQLNYMHVQLSKLSYMKNTQVDIPTSIIYIGRLIIPNIIWNLNQ